jgi:hypothetical protein
MNDNAYFLKQLIYEIILQYYSVVRTQRESDYTLKGTIEPVDGEPIYEPVMMEPVIIGETYSPVPDRADPPIRNFNGRREFFSMDLGNELYFYDSTGEDNSKAFPAPQVKDSSVPDIAQEGGERYYLKLEISNTRTGEVLGNQSIVFIKADASVRELISTVIYNMLSNVPEIVDRTYRRDEFIFLEAGALWVPRIYYGEYDATNLLDFGLKFGIQIHFFQTLQPLSLGAGVQITTNSVDSSGIDFSNLMLEIPLSLRYNFNLNDKFVLEPYGGAAWNYSFADSIKPSTFSWFLGLQFGIKAGPGIIIFDPRFSMDFSNSVLLEVFEYQRYCMQLGVGYKFSVSKSGNKVQ